MDNNQQVKPIAPVATVELTEEEKQELKDGLAVKDITLMPGWKIIEGWLKSRAFHAWVDPRGLTKEEWDWAELNAFHSADISKEILQDVYETITKAEQLEDYKLGKGKPRSMKI
jgi:hypothetical protein